MEYLDSCIREIEAYIWALASSGRQVREWKPNARSVPGPMNHESNQLVLARDTAVELGRSNVGSCFGVLWTSSSELVEDGRIRLVGPDLGELIGQSVAFCQVLILQGQDIPVTDNSFLIASSSMTDGLPGVMSRISRSGIWCRISYASIDLGLCFAALGRKELDNWRSRIPAIERAEVLFLTSGADDLVPLQGISALAEGVIRSQQIEKGRQRGYDLTCSLASCAGCEHISACAAITKSVERENMKPAKREEGTGR